MIVKLKEAGFVVSFSPIYWTYASGFPKSLNIGKTIDKREGAERKVIGKNSDPRYKSMYLDNKVSFVNVDELNPDRFEKDRIELGLITEPTTDKAKELNGSYAGCNLKPAVEVILVVMKPLSEKSYTDQAITRVQQEEDILNEISNSIKEKYNEDVVWG